MKVKSVFCLAVRLMALLGTFSVSVQAQEAKASIKAQIERIQDIVRRAPAQDEFWNQVKPGVEKSLALSQAALKAGRLYLALQELSRAQVEAVAIDNLKPSPEVLKAGMQGFDLEWNKTASALEEQNKQAGERTWAGVPAAVQALSEEALCQTMPLMEGSRGFAAAEGPESGLYYIRAAEAKAEFSRFSAALPVSHSALPFLGRSMLAELDRVQQKTLAAFQPPRSIDLHSEFIRLNATLELGRELDAARFYAGSFYKYLDATEQYGLLEATAPDAAKQAQLRRALTALQDRVSAAKPDNSLAQVYVERAETLLEKGSKADLDDWKSVQVIVEQVLPAYFEAQAAVPREQLAVQKVLTLTLVRWPYT